MYTSVYGRVTGTCMAQYCREYCGGSITREFIHGPVYLCNLSKIAESCANTLPPVGNTNISTKRHVGPQAGRPRRCNRIRSTSSEVFSWSYRDPTALQPYTQALIIVTSPGAGLLLFESCYNMLNMHQLIIACWTMDIVPRWPFRVYVANHLGNWILFNMNMVVAPASKAPDCILRHLTEEPNRK